MVLESMLKNGVISRGELFLLTHLAKPNPNGTPIAVLHDAPQGYLDKEKIEHKSGQKIVHVGRDEIPALLNLGMVQTVEYADPKRVVLTPGPFLKKIIELHTGEPIVPSAYAAKTKPREPKGGIHLEALSGPQLGTVIGHFGPAVVIERRRGRKKE